MVYFDIIQFCLANASRSNRMASCVHDPSLKAMYVESTNHWRHLAEQMKSARPDQAVQRAITDMGRADFAPSILEAPERTVRQIAQSRHDNVKSENTTDHQLVLRDRVVHLENKKGAYLRRQTLNASRDDAESQRETRGRHDVTVNSIGQIEARRDPLTGQWECLIA